MAKSKKEPEFKLVGSIPYYLQDNGDGSASPVECKSEEFADEMGEIDLERHGQGGNGDNGSIPVYEKDGQLYFFGVTGWNEADEEWEYEYIPLVK